MIQLTKRPDVPAAEQCTRCGGDIGHPAAYRDRARVCFKCWRDPGGEEYYDDHPDANSHYAIVWAVGMAFCTVLTALALAALCSA